MVPIPGLEDVVYSWVTIEAEKYQLHGFLLYTASDHYFPEYIDGEGLGDLDVWSGDSCAIFVVHSPSAKWIEYTRTTNHIWWKLFGKRIEGNLQIQNALRFYGSSPVLQIGDTRKSIQEIFAPSLNSYLQGQEIANILSHFNLRPTQHPCLILFKTLDDESVWYIDMSDMVDMPQRDLRSSLKKWFAGKDFKRIVREVSNA